MLITITDNAVAAIRDAFTDEGTTAEASYLRVGVRGGGCSGLAYDLSVDTEKREGDLEIEKDGVRLLVDVKSQLFLTGITLDYTKGLNGKGFVFMNPNATGTCGCGESFSV
jgi:iron-sulfur cluster assembly protein